MNLTSLKRKCLEIPETSDKALFRKHQNFAYIT